MQPSEARNVLYQAYGTPGGEYPSVPRAAIITEVEKLPTGDASDETAWRVGVCVLNPSGIFFNRDVKFDPGGAPGTWRWPPRV